jgi:S1-C subfamily serine protease
LVVGLTGGQTLAQDFNRDQLVEQTVRATAWVVASYENSPKRPAASSFLTSTGTGFLVDRTARLLITNEHVLGNSATVRVYFPWYQQGRLVRDRRQYVRYDRPVRGWVVAADPRRDLALIQLELVPPDVKPLSLAAAGPRRSERVVLVGNPGQSERDRLWVANTGTVQEIGPVTIKDPDTGRELRARVASLRTEEAVRKGNSGGPVVNARGQLVGVVTRSNAGAAGRLPAAWLIGAWAASVSGGPLVALPLLNVRPEAVEHLAVCVDAREVGELLKLARARRKPAQSP